MDTNKFSDIELDALREVGNVGIGNAVTALAKLLNKRVGINIPETRFIPIEKFAEEVGGPETLVSGIYLKITGDLDGESIFVLPIKDAKEFIELLTGQKPGDTFTELHDSALKEMSNIFVGVYLNAMADMLGMKLYPSVPNTATDMAQSIVDYCLINLGKYSDRILIVKEKINIEGNNIDGIFIIIFSDESLNKMLNQLKMMYKV